MAVGIIKTIHICCNVKFACDQTPKWPFSHLLIKQQKQEPPPNQAGTDYRGGTGRGEK